MALCRFVKYCLVNLQFVCTLYTKTSYSQLNKPQTLKLKAKTGGPPPRTPPLKQFVADYKKLKCKITDELGVNQTAFYEPKTSLKC